MNVKTTISYLRYDYPEYPDGLPTYNDGIMTTHHSQSHHGQPVYVAKQNYRTTDPLTPNQVYSHAELPEGYNIHVHPTTTDAELAAIIRQYPAKNNLPLNDLCNTTASKYQMI